MSSPASCAGPRRVIIDHVTPAVDGGAFPFKRVMGDRIPFRAHVFADSHDQIKVELRVRRAGEAGWSVLPMWALGNDEFMADYDPPAIGLYEFQVAGVVDHFGSWLEGFRKKRDSGEPLDVELLIGANWLREAAQRAEGAARKRLSEAAAFLSDPQRDQLQRVQLAADEDLAREAGAHPNWEYGSLWPLSLFLVERERAAFSAWYEFFPRSAVNDGRSHGRFSDAQNRLPEIARLGFDVVYLPPIHPIGREHRKGRNNALVAEAGDVGSPWAIGSAEGGHQAIHPELGTIEAFQEFIRAAEDCGLEVALDIAFQCAPDHPWVKEHPDWFRWRPDGTVQYAENPPKKYQDILPLNFESEDWKGLWHELKSVFDYWIGVGVKIFRVDNPHTKSFEFWRWCILEIKREHPEALFLAEAFTRPKRKYRLGKSGFTHGYTYFTWRNHPREMEEYLEELTESPVREYFWPHFWPNTPDILHADLQFGNRATFVGRLVLAATLSSNYGIYGPAFELMDQEPFPGKEEYNHNEKYQLKIWDHDQPGNLRPEIARLNRIRREHVAFQRTFNLSFIRADNPHFIAYLKQNFDRSDQFIIVVNMDWDHVQEGMIEVPLDKLGLGSDAEYRVQDLFDPAQPEYRWRGSRNYVRLDPARCPVHIFHLWR